MIVTDAGIWHFLLKCTRIVFVVARTPRLGLRFAGFALLTCLTAKSLRVLALLALDGASIDSYMESSLESSCLKLRPSRSGVVVTFSPSKRERWELECMEHALRRHQFQSLHFTIIHIVKKTRAVGNRSRCKTANNPLVTKVNTCKNPCAATTLEFSSGFNNTSNSTDSSSSASVPSTSSTLAIASMVVSLTALVSATQALTKARNRKGGGEVGVIVE
ncbi:hypothetical protein KCU62_g16, partial [Aureobasidium sp. EXF-3399]